MSIRDNMVERSPEEEEAMNNFNLEVAVKDYKGWLENIRDTFSVSDTQTPSWDKKTISTKRREELDKAIELLNRPQLTADIIKKASVVGDYIMRKFEAIDDPEGMHKAHVEIQGLTTKLHIGGQKVFGVDPTEWRDITIESGYSDTKDIDLHLE